jgi:hypothetical protein
VGESELLEPRGAHHQPEGPDLGVELADGHRVEAGIRQPGGHGSEDIVGLQGVGPEHARQQPRTLLGLSAGRGFNTDGGGERVGRADRGAQDEEAAAEMEGEHRGVVTPPHHNVAAQTTSNQRQSGSRSLPG